MTASTPAGGLAALILSLVVAPPAAGQRIHVERNVRVSRARSSAYDEVRIAANLNGPSQLLLCAETYPDRGRDVARAVHYASVDGGRRWTLVREVAGAHSSGCAIGDDGTFHSASAGPEGLVIGRSADRGSTWQAGPRIDAAGDQDLSIATSGNWTYLASWPRPRSIDDSAEILIRASSNGGETFGAPVALPIRASAASNALVLDDGMWLATAVELDPRAEARCPGGAGGRLELLTATPTGGAAVPIPIAAVCLDPNDARATTAPNVAIDRTRGPFRDRLYVTWVDRRTGRDEIMVTASKDHGRTWSPPATLDQEREPELISFDNDLTPQRPGWDRDNFLPRIAVSNQGVVGVAWSDRRDSPDDVASWQRFTASLDGGESWLKSVRVSERPSNWSRGESFPTRPAFDGSSGGQLSFTGGRTGSLVTDGAGRFHLGWIDNRSGTPEPWTATIAVDGKVLPHGSSRLSNYRDVSGRGRLRVAATFADRRRVAVDVQLENISPAPLKRPVVARLLALSSPLGALRVRDADNHASGVGAVWDFTPTIPADGLAPHERGVAKRLTFGIQDGPDLSRGEYPRFEHSEVLQFHVILLTAAPED